MSPQLDPHLSHKRRIHESATRRDRGASLDSPVTDDLLRRRPSRTRLAVAVTVAAILGATLFPSADEMVQPMFQCLACGQRGIADVILNVVLFAPLGVALRMRGASLGRVCLAGALLSAAIELAQMVIPGRDASGGDLLANTAGTAAGYAVAQIVPRLAALQGRAGMLLAVAAAALPAITIAVTGALLRPALPHSTYYGQWTPNLGHLEWYRGRVRLATLGSLELPPQRLTNSDTIRTLLLAGAQLELRATAGPPPQGLAPLFSIADDGYREILLVGVDRDDLVFRYRTRATTWRLDQPDLRVADALRSIRRDDSLAVTLWGEPDGYCLSLNGASTCRLRFTAGRGWAVLFYTEGLAPSVVHLLDAAWLAALLVPVGACVNRRRWVWAGGALIAGAAVTPTLVGLAATPPGEWLGALGGIVAGAALGTRAARRRSPQPP